MIKQTFRCNNCQKNFKMPKILYEKHNLDTPPYEKLAVCPKCGSTDFGSFDSAVEKIEVAEKLLTSVAAFNRYFDSIKDIFGSSCKNEDFNEGYEILTEFISEMFSFITVEKEREILNLSDQNDIQGILLYLKG